MENWGGNVTLLMLSHALNHRFVRAESPTDTFVDSLWMDIVALSEVKTTYLGVFDLQCGRRG